VPEADLVCGPADLADLPAAPGIQGQIQDEYKKLQDLQDRRWELPGLLFLLFSIPWLWYFLLGRIEELSAAIRGR
jgi:hypothetical protein